MIWNQNGKASFLVGKSKKFALNRAFAIKPVIFFIEKGGDNGKNQKCYHQCF